MFVKGSAIEIAYARLQAIKSSVDGIDLLAETEADTRLKLIDPILMDVLGWLPAQVHCEVTEAGGRLDYLLSTAAGGAVIEAKRPASIFNFENERQKIAYSLSGPILKSGNVASAIEQVKAYALGRGVDLAAVTNGFQWVVFLASRRDGVRPDSGFGFIFRSIEDLLNPESFLQFYALLSKPAIQSQTFRAQFSKAEGRLRVPAPVQAKRVVTSRKGGDLQPRKNEISKALDPLIRELFLTLTPEREAEIVRECFVETRESVAADDVLQTLISEISENIEKIDTHGSVLTREVEQRLESSDSQTVVLVGQIGAGKSTYLDRFFRHILRSDLRDRILLVRLQLEGARPDSVTFPAYLRRQTIDSVRRAVFGTPTPTFNQLKGAFMALYEQLKKGEDAPVAKNDPARFEELFSQRLHELSRDEEKHLKLLLSHCTKSMRKLICIVYDNVDHFDNEIQTLTFQHAQWVNGLGRVLSIVPIRDSTYWQASTRGPFHAEQHVTLYLPRPSVGKILTSRFRYAELQLDQLELAGNVSLNSLKGLRVKVEHPKELFQVLHELFSKEVYPNHILSGLSGGNVREALRIFHETITSPHMSVDKFLAAYLSQGQYKLSRKDKFAFERAVLLGPWAHFKQERGRNILNVICCPRIIDSSPLLALRICERLYDLRTLENAQASRGYESIADLLRFFSDMGVPETVVDTTIVRLVEIGLVEPYDRRVFATPNVSASADEFGFVRLSSSGRLHRSWLMYSKSFGMQLIQDMEIFNQSVFQSLEALFTQLTNQIMARKTAEANETEKQIARTALAYLAERDADNVAIPMEELAYSSQRHLPNKLFLWVLGQSSQEHFLIDTVEEPGHCDSVRKA